MNFSPLPQINIASQIELILKVFARLVQIDKKVPI